MELKVGFYIYQVITDNLSVNTMMFKELCGGKILPSIPHPEKLNYLLVMTIATL